jgi:hypothetical protein
VTGGAPPPPPPPPPQEESNSDVAIRSADPARAIVMFSPPSRLFVVDQAWSIPRQDKSTKLAADGLWSIDGRSRKTLSFLHIPFSFQELRVVVTNFKTEGSAGSSSREGIHILPTRKSRKDEKCSNDSCEHYARENAGVDRACRLETGPPRFTASSPPLEYLSWGMYRTRGISG